MHMQINPIGDAGMVILSKAFALQRHNKRILNLCVCVVCGMYVCITLLYIGIL